MRRLQPTATLLGPILVGFPHSAHAATAAIDPVAALLAVLALVVAVFGGWLIGRRSAPHRGALASATLASDDRLMWALWGSGDSFWTWEIDSDQLTWASADSMLGFRDRVSWSGTHWRERVVHRDDRERVEAAINAHLAGIDQQYEVEYRLRDAAGQWNWVRSRGRVVARDDAGKPSLVAGTFRVIERERAQDAQRRISDEVIHPLHARRGFDHRP